MNRVGDSRGNASEPNLADSACAKFIDLLVWVIEEVHLAGRRVCVHSNNVIGETTIDRRAVLRVIFGTLHEGHSDPHHDRSLYLIAARKRIEDLPRIDHCYHPADP